MSSSRTASVTHTHCEFNAILLLTGVPTYTGAAQRLHFWAYCDGATKSDLHDLVIPEEPLYRVEYYNYTKTKLLDGHYVKTDGTFAVRESKEPGGVPSLYVRADLMAVCPGDPRVPYLSRSSVLPVR
jgi:hypothetical protein